MDEENYLAAGVALHTVADFYSHSNYIDLYSKYAENGSYTIVLQVQNPSELGYSFAIHASGLYGDIIDILLNKKESGAESE